tara:strand:- start:134 stop:757 length:624 start_codon:yes stop_codon:yes gene_type:complete
MKLVRNTLPATEPITLNDTKAYLKVENSADDTLITSLIKAAREEIEEYTGLIIISQVWTLYLNQFPYHEDQIWWDGMRELPIDFYNKSSKIELPKRPVQMVNHIKTYSDSDVATTIPTSDYQVSTYAAPNPEYSVITLRDGKTWPTFTRNQDGIEIQFMCGYGNSAIPENLKQAIKILVAYRYCNREATGMTQEIMNILNSYKSIVL